MYPLVSIVVNIYNTTHLLDRALASVYKQLETFKDFEVIVVDDASTDNPQSKLAEWASKFDAAGISFTAICMSENSGYQASPKNRGIEFSHGDFIRFLDGDNEYTEGSVKALVDAALVGDVWPDVVYGRRCYTADPGVELPSAFKLGDTELVEHDPSRLAAGPQYNYIDTSDALIAKGVFWWLLEYTDMMWNENYRRFGDWELFCRMANLDKLVAAPPPRFKAVDFVVTNYHWTGKNLQLTRPLVETPVPKSAITGEVYART